MIERWPNTNVIRHRAPSRQTHRLRAALLSIPVALALAAGALSLSHQPAQQQDLVDLVLPAGAPAELGQWCVDHNTAAFRATLSSAGRNLLKGCVELWGAGLTPSPSSGPSPSPSATVTPSPSPSTTPSPSPTVSPTATTAPPTTPPATTTPPPSPSPTPTIGPVLNCLPQPSSCGFPDATNTGATGTLTVVTGNVTLSTPGMVYENHDVRGCIYVTAANVTIRNVKVSCPSFWVIRYDGQFTGRLLIEDVTIVCTGANGNTGGRSIGDRGYTARRVNTSGCADGFHADRDVTIEDSYCHDLPSELTNGVDNGLHVDCIQGVQTANITVRHNTLIAPFYSTSAIGGCCMPGTSVRSNWQVVNNLIDGGGYAIYCLRDGTETNSAVSGNRFGPGGWIGASGYADDCNDGGLVWSSNVRDATGALLPAK